MKSFRQWCEDNGIEYPEGPVINGSWFQDHGLPMVVACSCCGMTMALPNALIDEEGQTFCSDCGS